MPSRFVDQVQDKKQKATKSNTWCQSSSDKTCVVYGANAFMLRMSSVAGLAPLKFKPHNGGWRISLSNYMIVYSYGLITALSIGAIAGLVRELNLGVDKSVKMSSRMSQFVSSLDTLSVLLNAACGVYAAPRRTAKLIEIMRTLSFIDNELSLVYSKSVERKAKFFIVYLNMSFWSLLIQDYTFYTSSKSDHGLEIGLEFNYLPSFFLYCILFMLEVQFLSVGTSISTRFRCCNDAMQYACAVYQNPAEKPWKLEPITRIGLVDDPKSLDKVVTVGTIVDTLTFSKKHHLFVQYSDHWHRLNKPMPETVRKFSQMHDQICSTVNDLDNVYGLSLFMILLSTFLHLTVTPYYIIIELMAGNASLGYYFMQCGWTFAHTCRLLFLVEPCHQIAMQGHRTHQLLSDMLGVIPGTSSLMEAVIVFVKQSQLRSFKIVPFGVVEFSRPLIASIFGAVATFLVILVQFQDDKL